MAPLETADFGAGPHQPPEVNTVALWSGLDAALEVGAYLTVSAGDYYRPEMLPPYVEIADGARFIDPATAASSADCAST